MILVYGKRKVTKVANIRSAMIIVIHLTHIIPYRGEIICQHEDEPTMNGTSIWSVLKQSYLSHRIKKTRVCWLYVPECQN
mmetsp:Transcript_11130/g.27372  ORF Transcript_11130/g.27372 Transcript_11130/m.27372 type:complete len:80 (-) Transcript_11130:671-910(-)